MITPEVPTLEVVTGELQEFPPLEELAIETQLPEQVLAESVSEVLEPAAEMGVEEAAAAHEEVPPELPSWLAGVEAAPTAEEETGWTPPEEQASVEAAPTPVSETPFAAEPFQLAEAEIAQLDLNQAGLAELERLPGVGFTRAQAIITYRQAFGPFSSIDDLANVAGFESSLVDSLRDKLILPEVQPVETMLEGVDIHQMTLIQARNALIQGESTKALSHYTSLIKAKQMLPEVVQDLNEALYRFPVDISIWEALGDAHLRSGHLQSALDAYTKAEELIR
jgi:competence ComEA-like helix-hairpin-helix protein